MNTLWLYMTARTIYKKMHPDESSGNMITDLDRRLQRMSLGIISFVIALAMTSVIYVLWRVM